LNSLGDIELNGKNIKLCAQENLQFESQNQTIHANEVHIAATQKAVVTSNGKTQIKGSTVEHTVGGGAQSPTHTTPMEARPQSNVTSVQNTPSSQNNVIMETKRIL